jgi:hypothetical protein
MLVADGALVCRACGDEEARETAEGFAAPGCRSTQDETADSEPDPMTAHVVESWGEFFVNVEVGGKVVDVAGPFHDEADAQLAALRNSNDPCWSAPSWAKRRVRTDVRRPAA